ncbi:hypothetical protein G7Y89_g4607 [Cudoniella acicularis]|uniref:Uncharacterized protein n=1 Tax=Cudoniella acicularis TaxID=354080 RepID=A0A8H4W7A6_9HELO|nr:hypothetical protein G7Y89_g4607 [Cudoniella acicularis]
MPSPVTNSWYQLSNNYTGSDSFLSSDGTNGFLSIQNLTSDATNWQFSLSNHSYYIRNQALGASFRLSIAYEQYADQIIPKPAMQKYNATDESQRWLFQGEGNSFAIMNVALGSNLFLNVFSDTLEPYMSTWGGYSSQYWNMEKSPQIENAFNNIIYAITIYHLDAKFHVPNILHILIHIITLILFPFNDIQCHTAGSPRRIPTITHRGNTRNRSRSSALWNYGPQDTLISIPEEKAESRQHHDAGGGTLHSVVDERRKKGGEDSLISTEECGANRYLLDRYMRSIAK